MIKLGAHGTTPDRLFPVFPCTVFGQWLNSGDTLLLTNHLFVTLMPESAGKIGAKRQTPNALQAYIFKRLIDVTKMLIHRAQLLQFPLGYR